MVLKRKVMGWFYRDAATEGGDSAAAGSGDAGAAASSAASSAAASDGGTKSGDASAGSSATGAAGAAAAAGKGSDGGYWPDDWRDRAAAGDEKILARLNRYGSPAEVTKALIAAQNKISSGELKSTLGKNASAEEVAAYRKEHGIPETHDKYDLDLGGGFTVGEADKPLVDEFLKAAHATNQTPDQVKSSLKAYYNIVEQESARRADADRSIQNDAEESLRADWGPEFRRNINLIHGMLDRTTSPEIKELLLGGRLADGTPIGSSPGALKMLLGLALTENPSATVVPAGGGNASETIDSEIAKIESKMGTKAYQKDEKMQARYRELVTAREAFNKRK